MAMVRSPFIFSKKYASNVSWPNVIKFHVKHPQVEGKTAYGFWADWIGIVVAMAAYSSCRLIMGKSLKIFLEIMRPTAYIICI